MRIRYKKWARPELEASKFYIKEPEKIKGKWKEQFENSKNPIHLELGCGKGQFISKLALKNQNINYIAIDFVNGKNWERLDHDVEYFDKDMKYLYRKYMENNKLNKSKRLTENEEDPTQKILNFLRRRYRVEERNLGDEQDPIIYNY